ncbi:dienelactone hydrolase family protein [Chitinophagaceae bacterium 26-R-25]|nr:dienelactone hydrolase family protein [Chitinophagaceae bacterium 26-R-25]
MKRKIFTLLVILMPALGMSQTAMNCCTASATEAYAQNGNDKAFVASHPEPLPFVYSSTAGKDISYKTSDGKDAHAWEVMAAKKTRYYLVVVHEWWGLNDYIKQETEKLANELGVNAIAIDLYDKQVATTREDASKIMQTVTTERATAIIKGVYDYVGSDAKILTVGWCFGGGWSLQAALMAGTQLRGCAMYYGAPEKDVEKLKTLNADVIGFFGNKDKWPSPAMVDEFVENMKKANKKLIVNRYDATHGFANPSNPDFNKEATEDAHKKLISFFKERIK